MKHARKARVLGAFHQRGPFTSARPFFPSFIFSVAEFVPLLFVLPASPSAPSSSANERGNLLYAVSGLLFFFFFSFAVAVVGERARLFSITPLSQGRRAQRIMGLGAVSAG